MAARARKRWTGKTAERGYGRPHQSLRERRLRLYRPGDPCAHCGQPITWPLPLTAMARRHIDLPHTADRSGYLPGLAHRYCNRRDGAVRGYRARRRVRTWQSARSW